MIIDSISEDKNTIQIGVNTFVFVEESPISSCKKCAFLTTDDCRQAPCMPFNRKPVDSKEGHFELKPKFMETTNTPTIL